MKKEKQFKLHITHCLLLIVYCQFSFAQTPISLQAAIDTAFKNNLSLKNEKLNAEYYKKLKSSGFDVPQTTVTGEYGQINSFYKDTKFGVAQSIKFPTVYAKQKTVLNEEWKNSMLNVAVKQNDLKKNVTQVFYELMYLQEKKIILQHIDSVYEVFLKNTEMRFNKGESNILEKITAETQRGQVNQQLKLLEQDYSIVQLQLKLLLNSNNDFIPSQKNIKIEGVAIVDTSLIKQHPFITQLKQQQQIGVSKFKLERSKLLPDLFISYNNMSMRGFGSDEKYYTASSRFQSVQAGIGLPLFFGSQKSKISALRINKEIAENNYITGVKNLQSEYQQELLNYNKHLQTVTYFENTALKNAELILTTANKQFSNGEINYLEWVLLINQSVSIQSDYVDAIKNLNQSAIQLNSLTNK